jgi:thymidylate kinase
VDLETAARRLDRPLDRLESRGDEYRRRLRDGYHAEAARSPDSIVLVDARGDRDDVAAAVRAEVAARFPELE